MNVLTPYDLFTFGIGLDIAGAILVARGLMIAPSKMLIRSSTHAGWSSSLIVGYAEDWSDGLFGLSALICGFTFQAIGYAVLIEGSHASVGVARSIVAVAWAFAAAGVVFALWGLSRRKLLLDRIVQVGRARAEDPGSRPDGTILVACAGSLGYADRSEERPDELVRRVYGVREISVRAEDDLNVQMTNARERTNALAGMKKPHKA